MKKTFLTSTILLLVSFSTAAGYDIVLVDNDLKNAFSMKGSVLSPDPDSTEVVFKYNISQHEEAVYNKTKINSFKVAPADGNKTIVSKNKKIGELDSSGFKSGYINIESSKSPDRIDNIKIIVDYKATFINNKDKKTARNSISHEINSIHPEIESFTAEDSNTTRGGNITVTAKTSSIEQLKTGETNFSRVKDGLFRSNLTVPHKISTNKSPRYTLRDGRGNSFRKELDINIVNTPPEIELEYNPKVQQKENTRVTVKVSDDHRINQTYVQFRGRKYTVEKQEVKLLTSDIPEGNHSFQAVAIDSDGAKTTKNGVLRVQTAKKEDSQQTNRKNNDRSPVQKEEESLITPLINFLESVF